MIDHEFFQALSELIDKKLEPIKNDIQNINSNLQKLQLQIGRASCRERVSS